MENATLTVGDHHQHGLVLVGFIGERGGEDGDVFGGAAQAVVEFVFGVHPLGGQAAEDRVVGDVGLDQKFVLGAVAAAGAGGEVFDPTGGAEAEVGAGFFVAPAPTTEADDRVVVGPVGEGVIGGVIGDEAAAVFDVGEERGVDGGGPTLAVVVGDDDVVAGEGGAPFRPERGRGGLVSGEGGGVFLERFGVRGFLRGRGVFG